VSGVKRYDCTSGGAQFCQGCYTMERDDEYGDYVLFEDYDRLRSQLDDAAMLIGRLAHSLRKANPANGLPAKALDYLDSIGKRGNPLRNDEQLEAAERRHPAAGGRGMNTRRIATSPLTGRIYCGRLNKAGTAFLDGKEDATSDVLAAIIDKAKYHGGSFDVEGGGMKFVVTVTQQDPAP